MKKKQILEDNAVVIDKKLNQYETAKLFPKKSGKNKHTYRTSAFAYCGKLASY